MPTLDRNFALNCSGAIVCRRLYGERGCEGLGAGSHALVLFLLLTCGFETIAK